MTAVGRGYHFRNVIKKNAAVEVDTGVFQREEDNGLSALLCSRVEPIQRRFSGYRKAGAHSFRA